MNEIKVRNIFAAVSDKSVLDSVLDILDRKLIKFWGTEGTVKYLKSKGFDAESVVKGYDFDGRVKTLDRSVFVRILADRTNKKHLSALRVIARIPDSIGETKQSQTRSLRFARDDREAAPFDLVIVDLYPPDPKIFPQSMDIGGQALIRAAVKNYKNVALAFDERSLGSLVNELTRNDNSTTLSFRKKQAQEALKFIADRSRREMNFDL